MMNRILFFIVILLIAQACEKQMHTVKTTPDYEAVVFRDTVYNIAFDSLSNDLGNIIPSNAHNRFIKHFKYIGTDSIRIAAAWTSDPHFICEYPQEYLVPGKIYSCTVCFWHEERQGVMHKTMGFDLSDANRITFTFTGKYLPISKDE